MLGILGALAFVGISPAQFGGDPSKDMLLVGEKAYGMILPVKVCCPAQVSRATWSSDGNYALFLRHDIKLNGTAAEKLFASPLPPSNPPPIEKVISIWSKASEKTFDVWKDAGPETSVDMIEWVTGSTVALASITQTFNNPADPRPEAKLVKQSVVEIDARTNSVRSLRSRSGESGMLGFIVSKNTPLAAIYDLSRPIESGQGAQSMLLIYRPGTGLQQAAIIPQGTNVYGWDRDGKSLILMRRKPLGEGVKAPTEYGLFNAQSGQITMVEEGRINYPMREERPNGELAIYPDHWGMSDGYSGTTGKLEPIWLVDGKTLAAQTTSTVGGKTRTEPSPAKPQGALVTSEAEFASLCPTGEGVLYVTRGVALYRPIVAIPKEMYLKAKAAAERTVFLSNAKQVALGMIMYSSDHDDNLPSSAGNWQGDISPYLKNDSLSSGFNYTFSGGNIAKIENPAQTELGYFQIDGGRVVAYCDGHVKWVPDK